MTRPVTRRFPDYGWAWPRGDLDLLLKAVMLADDKRALAMGLDWLARHDIDDAAFREQRLLTALSERFGKHLAASPAYPRLVGLQRMLWSRSQLALRDTGEALAMLHAADIPFMLLKGAARVAMEPGAQRGRVSHDIDILLQRSDMRAAFALLLDAGWEATSGAGAQRLKDLAGTWRATNFVRGEFGDVDIHRLAYHPAQASGKDDEGLWTRSVATHLAGVPARAPAASDRIALAIAHGALDAHTHSDWLCDIDACTRAGPVVWADLLATLKARRVLVPAASALTYLGQEIGTPIPGDFLATLIEAADRSGVAQRLTLLECKPRTDFNALSATARGLVKEVRLWSGKRTFGECGEPIHRARVLRGRGKAVPGAVLSASLDVPPPGGGVSEIVIAVTLPRVRRRVDWELAGPDGHIAVLRHRKLFRYTGQRLLSFRLDLPARDGPLTLTARPSRLLRGEKGIQETERFGALPFSVVRVVRPGAANG